VTVDDLLTLSSLSPKNFDNFLEKKGFLAGNRNLKDNAVPITFFEKKEPADTASPFRNIEIYKKSDAWCFKLETSCKEEYQEGKNTLKKAGFFYDKSNDTSRADMLLFQKGSIAVTSSTVVKDDQKLFSFVLEKKEFPDPGNIQFAEDLLKFDSHEHLVGFFGENNVKKDVYFFSDEDSKNCTVLFPNSSRQAVFIWEDPANLYKVSFVIISGTISTASTANFSGNFSQNTWRLRNGVYSGMRLKDLLKMNANDFKFYGRSSEYSYMIVPEKTRYIDFTKVGILLDCFDCAGSELLNQVKVSAEEATQQELAFFVSSMMIFP
jgi:hypothetical protein